MEAVARAVPEASSSRAAAAARAALLVAAAWLPVQYLFTRTWPVLPPAFVWLDDVALALGAALALSVALARGGVAAARTPLDAPVLACLGAGVASAAWNDVPPWQLALALRGPLEPVLAFHALWWLRPPPRWLARAAALSLALALAQVPVAVAQLARTHAAASRDLVFGTFWVGASNSVAYYLLVFALPLLGAAAAARARWPAVAAAALAVPFGLCGSRGALYLGAPLALVAVWPSWLRPPRALSPAARGRGSGPRALPALAFAAALALSVAGLHAWKPPVDGAEVAAELSPRRLWIEAWDRERGMGRLWYARWIAARVAAAGPGAVALGVGPGRFSSSAGAWLGAPLLAEATRGGHSAIIPGQLVATASEYGVAGLAAFGWLVAAGIAAARRGWRAAPDGLAGGLRRGAFAASLFLVAGTPLENVWELPHFAIPAWAAIGWCALAAERRRDRE